MLRVGLAGRIAEDSPPSGSHDLNTGCTEPAFHPLSPQPRGSPDNPLFPPHCMHTSPSRQAGHTPALALRGAAGSAPDSHIHSPKVTGEKSDRSRGRTVHFEEAAWPALLKGIFGGRVWRERRRS